MFLPLAHTKLQVYQAANELVVECFKQMKSLPGEEKFSLSQQIKRAAISAKLNIAEGATRRSISERRRFFEISRGSIVEIDAALEVCVSLGYLNSSSIQELGILIKKIYGMLSNMIK